MGIGNLCTMFKIPDETWKSVTVSLLRHLFLINLFPGCDGRPGDVVRNIMGEAHLNDKDVDGAIYSTVSDFCSHSVHELYVCFVFW
jgi:hypothetical protein